MSNLPNPYNSIAGPQPPISGTFQQHNQIPVNQIAGIVNQDGNSISSASMPLFNSPGSLYTQSANSSPAFNHPGMLPPPTSLQSSPMRPIKPIINPNQNPSPNIQNIPQNSIKSQTVSNVTPIPPYYPPNIQQGQINNNAPPLVPSSQYSQPLVNGPLRPVTPQRPLNQYNPASSSYLQSHTTSQSYVTSPYGHTVQGNPGPSSSMPLTNHSSVPFSGPPLSGPRNSPLMTGPSSITPLPGSGSHGPVVSSGSSQNHNSINGPLIPDPRIPNMPPPSGLPSGPSSLPAMSGLTNQNGPMGYQVPPNHLSGPTNVNSGPQMPSVSNIPMLHQIPSAPAINGPPRTNFQNRYPQMPQSNVTSQQQMQQNTVKQFPQPNTFGITQQMGQLSVTKQGFDQLWGHQMVDLMQCKHILPEYPEDPPDIKLSHQFADAPNCSPEIFRCTINRVPETNNLLQKSRLPLGILIHPFKDLNHLPVIQCTTIVRCRACRTYINPFVYFVDAKRWKCNLCYRVNDLPEEFQYDPVSKSYGDPSRRPEIKSATIEFIAPSEYMLRPPQPAVYLFLMDVSQLARDSGYLQVACDTIKENLESMPGDARMQVGFVCYDAHVHYYLMGDGRSRPQEMTVLDIDDIFLPSPESLLVNLGENRDLVTELLTILPQRFSGPGVPASALGAALQAAYKLMAPTGGRVTVFQTCLPNIGPGALQSREDPNSRSGKEVAHLSPATDFYKRLALDCSGAQVALDLFLLSAQYCDLATISGMSKFSAGSVHHVPLFRATRPWQAERLRSMLTRYLTRKIGFEAVMRVRCTRGVSIHTFHGNFFVRSTDLLSLPNVSPDAGFAMQLTIEESLADLQQVCFQAALLYTSSKGERRIRVHTLALPVASTLPDVLHAADQLAIVGLLANMAVDRSVSASMSEAREALTNVAVDVLSAHRLAQNLPAGALSASLHAPAALRLLPLYILALLKRKAFRTGTSTRLDERVADMCAMKSAPLVQLVRAAYPDLYAVHRLGEHAGADGPDPPRLQLTAERINSNGAYLLDDGESMVLYVCHGVSPAYLSDTFGVAAFSQLPDEARALPALAAPGCDLLRAFIDRLNDDRPYPADLLILRDNSPARQTFTDRLVDDRVESSFSYYEFLQHIKNQVK